MTEQDDQAVENYNMSDSSSYTYFDSIFFVKIQNVLSNI